MGRRGIERLLETVKHPVSSNDIRIGDSNNTNDRKGFDINVFYFALGNRLFQERSCYIL